MLAQQRLMVGHGDAFNQQGVGAQIDKCWTPLVPLCVGSTNQPGLGLPTPVPLLAQADWH